MNKNKFGQETKWSLYSAKINDGGRTIYFWVDENNVVQFERTICQIGWTDIPNNNFETVGTNLKDIKKNYVFKIVKNNSHSMTDEHLSKGWLLL